MHLSGDYIIDIPPNREENNNRGLPAPFALLASQCRPLTQSARLTCAHRSFPLLYSPPSAALLLRVLGSHVHTRVSLRCTHLPCSAALSLRVLGSHVHTGVFLCSTRLPVPPSHSECSAHMCTQESPFAVLASQCHPLTQSARLTCAHKSLPLLYSPPGEGEREGGGGGGEGGERERVGGGNRAPLEYFILVALGSVQSSNLMAYPTCHSRDSFFIRGSTVANTADRCFGHSTFNSILKCYGNCKTVDSTGLAELAQQSLLPGQIVLSHNQAHTPWVANLQLMSYSHCWAGK